MSTTARVFLVLGVLMAVVLGLTIPRAARRYKEQDRRFAEAMRTRQPRPGEQAAEMQAAMEDIRRHTPQLTPEQQQMSQALNQAAPGSPTFMELMLSAESVRTMPEPRKTAALNTVMAQLSNTDPGVRMMALQTLGRMGDRRVYPYVYRSMSADTDPKVRGEARKALLALGYSVP